MGNSEKIKKPPIPQRGKNVKNLRNLLEILPPFGEIINTKKNGTSKEKTIGYEKRQKKNAL
jgi:hypothetical protein